MSKTVKYLLAIAILLGLNLLLFFSDGSTRSSSFDQDLFLVSDTTLVNQITMRSEGEEISLKRNTVAWLVNNKYRVDQSFLKILFSILNKVEVKRQVGAPGNVQGEVEILFEGGDPQRFEFSTDALSTKSFFIKDGVSYQVEVPGYRDNVVNIFELNEDQWRNRIVFDGSWRTIQRLNITSSVADLNIQFNSQFFNVDGVNAIDSSRVVEYLNQFQYFQANEMISEGRFPELDEVRKRDPLAVLSIQDIKSTQETIFTIYPNAQGQSYHLVTKNNDEMMVFDGRRIQGLLQSNEDFEAQ